MGRVTLQTIADEVSVSRMTVSNAFSRPDQLSPALRTEILSVADRLGYCGPDPAARTLSRGRSGTVGVLFTDTLTYAFTDEVATTFLAGVAAVLESEGIGLTVLSTPRRGPTGSVRQAVVDGLIIYSVDTNSPGLDVARRRDLPLVMVDQPPEPGTPSVNVTDRAGARAAAEHVIDLGHRRLGIVLDAMRPEIQLVDADECAPHYVVSERLAGWQAAAAAAGLATPLVANTPTNDRRDGAVAAGLILDAQPDTSALLCLSDEMALGAIDAIGARGLRVPDDISVVGFDDTRAAALTTPALTTVRQPVTDKGRVAARALLDRLDGATPAPVLLPTELIVRASTGPFPRP